MTRITLKIKNTQLLFYAIVFFIAPMAIAQCPSPNAGPLLQHFATSATGLTPATIDQPVDANGVWGGNFVRVNVVEGETYTFSLVGSEERLIAQFGSSAQGFPNGVTPNPTFGRPEVDFDPILTIYDNTGTDASNGAVVAFNEDASPTEVLPELEYTATYTGELFAFVDPQPGTDIFVTSTGPPNVLLAASEVTCASFATDSTSLRVTRILRVPSFTAASRTSLTELLASFSENVQTNEGNPTDFTVIDGINNAFPVSNQADGTAGDPDIVLTVADTDTAVGDLMVTYTNNNNEISDFNTGVRFAASGSVIIDIDSSLPTMVSGTRDSDTQITLTLSEPIQTNGGNPTDFTIVDADSTPFVVTAQTDGIAQDNQIVLTVADFSTATGPLTLTYTNTNDEISDFGSNLLATDAVGVEIELVSLSPVITYGNGFDLQLTAIEQSGFDGTIEESNITDHAFSPDGKKLFTIGFNNSNVFQFDVLMPFDLGTASTSAVASFDIGEQEQGRNAITFSPDGSMMFITGSGSFGNFTGTITRYDLSTPFDINTASFNNNTFTTDTQTTGPRGLIFNPDGSKMFITGASDVFEYDLDTPFDVSSAMFNGISFAFATTSPFGLQFSADGLRMFIGFTSGTDAIFQYDLSNSFDLSNVTDNNISFDVSGFLGNGGLSFDPSGSRLFIDASSGGIRSFNFVINKGQFIGEGFTEANANDGSIATTTLDIRLAGDTFNVPMSGFLDPTDFTVNNLPSGLTASIMVTASSATLALNGNATDHEFFDTIGSLNITFNDSAFTNSTATEVINAVNTNTGFGINFISCPGSMTTIFEMDPLSPPQSGVNPGWTNGVPGPSDRAIINADYDTSIEGNIEVCILDITDGNTLTIADDTYVQVQSDIMISEGGALIISNTGSIVQISEAAETYNNGSVSVEKITPTIDDRNYVAMSSPVTAEARDRVYGNSRAVFSIIPSNFVPFDIDLIEFPEFAGAENFLDDNNDYFIPVTGSTALPSAGIGQWVFPQPEPNVGDGAYTITYTQNMDNPGTLNSGTITVPINYNGPATVNNYNLLGNPYASAIDVTAFINANDAVNEVYYWDHITNPNSTLPGPGTSNFSMNDISIRNAMMGTAAVNMGGPVAPGQFMSSAQGFGIKALQSEAASNTPVVFTNSMRVTGNNDGFRSNQSISNTDKLWLNLTTSTYENATSQVGIGFTDDATAGYDAGYDTQRLGTFLSLFTNLEGEYLAIQGREAFNTQMELSVGFSTTVETEETYTISIDRFEGSGLENTPIYIIDNELNTITNLKDAPYSFTATKGIQSDRFIVVFEEREVLNLEEVGVDSNEISIFPNPTSNQVTLSYTGDTILSIATIINIQGKIVKEIDLSNFRTSQEIDIHTLAKGMYFMQIVSSDKSIVKKFIIR